MKRVMAIILAAVILFTSFTPVVATENSTTQTENKKVQWLVENNFLVGRRKDGDLKLGSTITRAEFTRMALVAKGEEDAAKEYPNVSTKFKDVDENHWATKLISYASEKGYISGYPDGNFKPEGEITYEEIISILARIHPNYTKIETKSNGWSECFIKFAAENGILEGLKIESSYKSSAIREKTFEMIYNFINIENNHVKETKSTKPIETKNENYFGWNGFYPYWFQFGYRPRAEKPVEPEVKPEPGTPDVKPEPEEPKEPETPEKPNEFDKENIAKIEIKTQPNLTYTEGDKLDLTGLVVTLTDNQGLTKDVKFEKFGDYKIITSLANGTPLTVDDHNGKTVVISKDEVTVETEALKVNPKVFDKENIKEINVKTQPTLNYTEGETLDLSELVITLIDNQNLTKDIKFENFEEFGITTDPTNGTPLTITDHNGKTVVISKDEVTVETEALKVNPKVFDKEKITKIKVISQPSNVNYTEGETLDLTGLRVELTDNQGLTEEIGLEKFGEYGITTEPTNGTELKPANNGTPVVISKGEVKAETEALKVNPKVFDPNNITKIEVKDQPTKLTYTEEESLDLTGIVVTLTDNQDLTKEISLEKFGEYGITTEPTNGTELKIANNDTPVVISKGEVKVATEALTVKEKVFDPERVETITVKTQPKLNYIEGEALDLFKLVVILKDNQDLTKEISLDKFEEYGITTSPENRAELKLSDNAKTVVISKGTVTVETEALKVNPKVFDKEKITKIEVKTQPKLNYTEGEKLDLSKLVVILKDNQDLTKEIEFKDFKEYGITTSPENRAELKLSDNAKTLVISKGTVTVETEALKVNPKVFDKEKITKITVKTQPKLTYTEGEKLDLTGLEVTLTDNQGLTKDVTFEKFDDFNITASPANETTLTSDHNGKTVEISKGEVKAQTDELTVNPKVFDKENIIKIEVKAQPNLTYTEGEQLDLTGLEVTLTDNQGLTKDVEFKDFKEYGLMTDPTSETQLTADRNGTKIKITKGNLETETNALTVNEKVFDPEHVETITVKIQPKLTYTEDEKLDLSKLVVTLKDNQGLTIDLEFKDFKTYELKTSPENGTPLSINDHNGKTVVISKGEAKAETDALTVKEKVFDKEKITKIKVISQPSNVNYTEGETLDLTGLRVELTDNQGLTEEIGFEEFSEYRITTDPTNETPLTMQNNGNPVIISKGEVKAETNALTVKEKVFDPEHVETITVKTQPKLNYTEGDKLDLTGLVVTLTDNQGLTEEIVLDKFEEYGITTSPTNGTPLTVDHNGKSVVISKGEAKAETDPLTVKFFDKDNITKIEVITQPKLEYFEREFLDLTGLKVRLTDSKEATKEVEFKDFSEYGIKTRPSNTRQLLMGMYKEVEIYKDTIKTTTDPLIIEKRVFDINLLKSIIISIPKDLSFNKGENLNLVDLRVTLLDSNYATEKLGITGIIAKGYKFEITPSDGTVLGIEHNKKPIIVEVEGVQGKSDPIYVNIKINFMQANDNVYSTKVIQPYTTVEKPQDPTKEGYKFAGWYTDLTFETPFDFDKELDDNMEVYAKWEEI